MHFAGQNNNIAKTPPYAAQPCCCCCPTQVSQTPTTQAPAVQTQNIQQQTNAQPVQTYAPTNAYVSNPNTIPAQGQGQIQTQQNSIQQQSGYYQYPYVPSVQAQAQSLQIPANTSGVNIQIFNPSVGTPGAAPTYNVNAPCYPSQYYTSSIDADGKLRPNNDNNSMQNKNNTNNGQVNTGNNNNNTENTNTNSTTTVNTQNNDKKTEKRKIIQLTDNYIKNLENYLDSQDKQIRLNAAKEVYARLEEDDSRFDDKALTALINKMLQDPSREIRFIALTALDGRLCKGDDYTVGVLNQMQANNNDPLNQEAADANSILLKMSGREVEKEFEVKEKKTAKANEMSDKFKPEGTKL